MYQRDYLMRQIWALTEWIGRNAAKHPDRETLQKEALRAEFGDWYKKFRLPPLNVWLRMNEEDALRLLNYGDHPQYERYFSAALLLKAEADWAWQNGEHELTRAIFQRSLYSALCCWRTAESGFLDRFRVSDTIIDLWQTFAPILKCTPYDFPPCTLFEFVLFWESLCQFDRSEDALFAYSEMQIQHPKSQSRALRFSEDWFVRMLSRSENELKTGGWSHDEVRTCKNDWENQFKMTLKLAPLEE